MSKKNPVSLGGSLIKTGFFWESFQTHFSDVLQNFWIVWKPSRYSRKCMINKKTWQIIFYKQLKNPVRQKNVWIVCKPSRLFGNCQIHKNPMDILRKINHISPKHSKIKTKKMIFWKYFFLCFFFYFLSKFPIIWSRYVKYWNEPVVSSADRILSISLNMTFEKRKKKIYVTWRLIVQPFTPLGLFIGKIWGVKAATSLICYIILNLLSMVYLPQEIC